jgi:hypothetical protein
MKSILIQDQRRLAELGLYDGAIDGLYGYKTEAAIRAFQRLNGLEVDGIIGPKTKAELFPEPFGNRDDWSAPTSGTWPTQADADNFYGRPGSNHAVLELPFSMRIAWNKNQTISRFVINEKCHASALRCFNRINDAYSPSQRRALGIDLFGGCYAKRKMRGGSRWSMHAYAAAIDFDPVRNQLRWGRDRARLAKSDADDFWRIWEEEGWVSLGRARNFDWMHVQAVRL